MNILSKELNRTDPATFNSRRAKFAQSKRKDRYQPIVTAPTLEEEIHNDVQKAARPIR
jgi:hypothetical protein